MARKGKIDLGAYATACPHCGGQLVLWEPPRQRHLGIRCLKCKCRWLATRRHARWGLRCPRYVKA